MKTIVLVLAVVAVVALLAAGLLIFVDWVTAD